MRKLAAIAAAIVMVSGGSAAAQLRTLTTGTGDGQVTVAVNGAGVMPAASSVGGSLTGSYNPVGDGDAATTIFESELYFRIGTVGNRTSLSSTTISNFTGTSTSASSNFSNAFFSGTLNQSVSNLFQSGVQTGSLLTQTYTFTNTTLSSFTLDLVRYLDGDLDFDDSLIDGGGVLNAPGGGRMLFEIDSATGASTASTFVGIYNTGGTANGFQIGEYSGFRSYILSGGALDGSVLGDGADADLFIDAGQGYDVTLGLGALFNLSAGGTGTLTTYTIFGSGAPEDVVIPGAVPEPATWAMMILGFGAVGGAMRRRKRAALAVA